MVQCNQHFRGERTLKFICDSGRLAVKTWKEWKYNGKKWKAHWNVLNCKLTFMRQKGQRSLENYCFNILLVIFLSRWRSDWRFLAVTNVMFVKSKLSPAAPHPLATFAWTSGFSLFLVVCYFFPLFLFTLFYCLPLFACFLYRKCKWMTGPPAGKQAVVFLWSASLCVCVCGCSYVSSPLPLPVQMWFVILYLCVFVCLCVCACGGAIYAQIRL